MLCRRGFAATAAAAMVVVIVPSYNGSYVCNWIGDHLIMFLIECYLNALYSRLFDSNVPIVIRKMPNAVILHNNSYA